MTRTIWLVVIAALGVAGCKGKKDNAATGSATPVGKAVGSDGSAAMAAVGSAAGSGDTMAGSAAAAAPVSDFLQKLGEKEGIVIGETQGAAVEGIPDGTKVDVVAVADIGVGNESPGKVTVKWQGKNVDLSPERVLREESLKRAPDGKHAVFSPMTACGDLCHTTLYVIGSDGKRAKVGEGGPDVVAAWSADNATVAVASGSLHLVTLADLKVKDFDNYTAPAYGPDGTLYVRDADGSAFKLVGDKATRVWKSKQKAPGGDEGMPAMDPDPVTFENGKPKFDEPFAGPPGMH
jgi:hypothetical protein